MIEIAKDEVARLPTAQISQTKIIEGNINVLKKKKKFDLIIFPYLLDVLSTEEIKLILAKSKTWLTTQGAILHIDFHLNEMNRFKKGFFKVVTFLLYLFFYLTSQVKMQALPNFHELYLAAGYTPIQEKRRFSGWLRSCIYKPEIS